MLIRHPITEFIYKSGYNGIDDLYDYWYLNKDDIIDLINRSNKFKLTEELLISFELKLRWTTWIGIWFRFYTKSSLKVTEGHFDFNAIEIKYGTNILFLDDFYNKVRSPSKVSDFVDLRGISMIGFDFKNIIIKNVDFSEACLDTSHFRNVTFINCIFFNTSFYRSIFENCSFDERCNFVNNDFTKAYIHGNFQCPISSPKIKYPSYIEMYRLKENQSVIYHTLINSKSFIQNLDEKKNKHKLENYLRKYHRKGKAK